MAGQLLLVNPRRRRRKNPRRRARHMSAKQRLYFGKRRSNPRRRRRHARMSNPRRHRRRARMSNPRRRHYRARRRNPIRRSYRRRRNPILGGGMIATSVMDSAVGVGGALLSDIAFNFLPLPANLKTGAMGTLAKAATSIALGVLSSKVVGSSMARKGTTGALTVQLYAYLKPMLAGAGVPGLGYYGAGYALNGLNAYISDIPSSMSGLGAFVPNSLTGLGDPSIDDGPLIDSSTYPGRFVGEYIPMR